MQNLGEPKFRGKQVAQWIYKRNAGSFEQMTDLPAALRQKLAQCASFTRSRVLKKSESPDGTVKYLLELSDSRTIESVLLPYEDRVSVCVSTQVGCAADCSFCATAISGLERSLTAGEIVDQILTLQEDGGRRITNVVFMGMGEPLLNYANTLKAIHILNKEVGIAMRKITVSTVGIIPFIRKLMDEKLQLTLAISLHAPNDELRQQIMPLTRKYPLQDLIAVLKHYTEVTGRRITFEYLLLDQVNDSPAHAKQLVGLISGMLANVNLIAYNEVIGKSYRRPARERVEAFRRVLEDAGIETTERFERGHAISAACGQLRRSAGVSG